MLVNEKILACRISEVGDEFFKVSFFNGEVKTCYYEDLPYLETGKNLSIGEIIKVRVIGNNIVPILSRPRGSNTPVALFDSRRSKKIDLMESFDYSPLIAVLKEQVNAELIRQQKGEIHD